MIRYIACTLLLFTLSTISVSAGRDLVRNFLQSAEVGNDESEGTRWAVLIAGSLFYPFYRHQADVCHAYQILKKNGIKDENIVVFMYDDIAFNEENPRPGVIINSPQGDDVYQGVPKDYTGENVTTNNFLSVILGNKTALTGGSGKVVDSGPNDHIFIYYSDGGGPGVLGMPTEPPLYADDLIEVLKKKHASGTYKSMVFYVEASDSGSMFDGLLPEDMNIYATTASDVDEGSSGTYCPGRDPSPPPEYFVCLGDLFSVAWMEDCDTQDLQTETLNQQYELVKERTKNGNYTSGSHVMQYGNLSLSEDNLSVYMGASDGKFTYAKDKTLHPSLGAVNQHDADLLYFWHKYHNAPEGSPRKFEAQKQLNEVMSHRTHIHESVKLIGEHLLGVEKGPEVMKTVRPTGQPLVDNWNCLKTLVRMFEAHCGSLSQYGLKYMRSFANLCNAGIKEEQMAKASAQTCVTIPSNSGTSLHKGFRA